jgi:glycosyltransferase involved in cell wall biosynthesis
MASLRVQDGVAEIVAVDDASTDNTLPILREQARHDARLRVFRNRDRLGVARNFERAIQLAGCPWIALADQDDLWLPPKLARLRAAWDGRACLVHHASFKFRGTPPAALPTVAGERRKFSGTDVRRLLYRNSIVGHASLVRAEMVRRLTPFPDGVPHDWWIGAGAAAHGSVQYVDEYLVLYRIHGGNAYHPAGSRWRRLRAEHAMRFRLLQALLSLGELPGPARAFAEAYRQQLLAAAQPGFPVALWRFYRAHAAVLFGGAGAPPPRLVCWRKSIAATLGVYQVARCKPGDRRPRRGPVPGDSMQTA